MADAHTIVREPTERLKDFNNRLAELCQAEPWTSARLDVVDGQPVVTLMFEADEATEEDVENEEAEKAGDPILTGPAVSAAVIRLRADDHRSWEKTENILEKIYEVAGDGVIADMTRVVTAEQYAWIKHPATEESVYVPLKVTYMIVVWERIEDEDEESEDEESEDEESEDARDEVTIDEDGRTIDAEATVIRAPRPSRRKQRENIEETEGEDD